jgi:NodT family efflux transporter outer membrane factor (OMF) lipoprotein
MKARVVLLTGVGLLAGCNVGPKYVKPPAPAGPAYKESAPEVYKESVPGEWQPAKPQDGVLKGKWWEIFKEPELNALEDQLNIDNQSIAQYFQNFMAARAQVREARSQFFPTLTANPALNRTGNFGKSSSSSASAANSNGSNQGGSFSNYSLPLEASWAPDLWGRVRNTVRQAQYAAQVSAADLQNEKLTEQSALAEYYFELRGQDSLQDLYNRTVEADRKALELTRVLVETGIDSPESVAQADLTLKNAEAAAYGIATNRAIYEHAIATLIGKPASSFSMEVKMLTTPVPSFPVGVPSQLLERRPDIAGAERTMAEANALIGVEKAAYYPTVSLTGSGGAQSSMLSKLFSVPALFWSLGASAAQTLFDAGLRNATVAQYTAQYNADVASYRQTVLTAFQQVEDSIATLRVTSGQIYKQDEAIQAAQRYLDIAMARWQTGLDPYLNVITAQTTLLSDQQTQVTLRVGEMMAAVQLIQALGGGWDGSQLPTPAQVTAKPTL